MEFDLSTLPHKGAGLQISNRQKIIRARRIAKTLKAGIISILNCLQAGKFSNFFATMQDKILPKL
jgi:hypothetical protein